MSKSLLEDIADLLTTEDSIYIGERPLDSPDNCSLIEQISGRPSQHVFGQATAAFRQPSIQITIRDVSYTDGYERCEDIIGVLDGYSGSGMNLYLESDIITLGNDDKKRSEFTMIYRLIVI